MTARLTNSVGLRLGINHSWKTKNIPYVKADTRKYFLKEQKVFKISKSMFRTRLFKKQSILYGQHLLTSSNQYFSNIDIFYHDLGYKKVLAEVRKLRMRRIIKRIKRPMFKGHRRRRRFGNKTARMHRALSFIIDPKVKVQKYGRLFRAFLYKLIRADYFEVYRQRVMTFFQMVFNLPKTRLDVRTFFLDYSNFTIKMVMAAIIKKLFLRFTVFEAMRPFRLFLSTRTFGYILRACGKLSKKQRAWYVKRHLGNVSNNQFSSRISYMYSPVTIKHGNVGIKLWLSL